MNTFLTPAHPDDLQLIQRHLAGDRAAFRQIVERYQGMVCALAYSSVGDVARSEDVAQEVFIAAWKQLPQLREQEKLRGWLCGITRNLAHNAIRRAESTPTSRAGELSTDLQAEGSDPRERAITADEAGLMWEALRGLPETYREPMVMFYRESQSMTAVADALEISEETVRKRLARGRAMLSERMAKLVEETLERTAPTSAFTGLVLVGLPGSLAPALVELSHGGGLSAAELATTGTIAGAVAKGGLAVKAVSVVALLPALVIGAEDFLRFRTQHLAAGDESVRRRLAWAYLVKHVTLGFVMVSIFVVPLLVKDFGLWRRYPLFGVAILIGMGASLWINRWLSRQLPASELVSFPDEPKASTFEYRTVETLIGWPLIHMRLGGRRAWRGQPSVKAWIAISDGRAVGLLFASGVVAVAPISLGVLSAGVLGIGALTAGVWALGGGAIGWVSQGVVAVGGLAAKSFFFAAGSFGTGAEGWATHFNDATARGVINEQGFYGFADFAVTLFASAAGLSWFMPVVLMGWQLWRTRHSARA